MHIEKINKKYCPECNFYLPVENFKKVTSSSALKKYKDGYYWCCSNCYKDKEWSFKEGEEPNNRKARRRDKRARRIIAVANTYGLSEDQYMELINQQNNLCAICSKKDINKVLCVEHDLS